MWVAWRVVRIPINSYHPYTVFISSKDGDHHVPACSLTLIDDATSYHYTQPANQILPSGKGHKKIPVLYIQNGRSQTGKLFFQDGPYGSQRRCLFSDLLHGNSTELPTRIHGWMAPAPGAHDMSDPLVAMDGNSLPALRSSVGWCGPPPVISKCHLK